MVDHHQQHDVRHHTPAGRTWTTVTVPVVAARTDDADTATRAMHRVLTTLARTWRPAQLTFVAGAGGGAPVSACWQAGADVAHHAHALADDLATLVLGLSNHVTLGGTLQEPTALRLPDPAPVADFVARTSAAVDYWSTVSPFWRVAAADPDQRWVVTVDVDALLSPDPTGAAPTDRPVELPEQPTPASMPGARLAAVRVRLYGGGARAQVMASLLAEDARGRVGLLPVAPHPDLAALTWMPVDLLAHLLAMPSRLPGGFPTEVAASEAELFAGIQRAATPHVLVLGKSGQGKTVFLSHLVDRAHTAGEATVVFDAQDGRLADAAVASAERHGRTAVVADFATPGAAHPVLDLTAAPPGVSGEQWSADLFAVLRSVLWASMPDEYFGPIGERAVRAMLDVAVLDPARRVGLGDLPRLFSAAGRSDELLAVLDRIGRDDLRGVVLHEVVPMLTTRDSGNAAIFLTSKFGPLIDDPALRAVTGRGDTLGVEDALATGRPFVLHAPASTLGDTGSRLICALAAHRLWLAARRRPVPTPVHVVADEWQLYATSTFESMLSQGRKFGLRLRVANQNVSQLDRKLRDSVLGNSGTIACFRVGPADAALVDGLFPTVTAGRLQSLRPHHLAVSFGDTDVVLAAPSPLPGSHV